MSLAFKTSEFTTSQKNTTEDKIIDIKLECKLSRSCNWDPPAIIAEKNNANNIVGIIFLPEAKTINIDKNPYPPEIEGTSLWWNTLAWKTPANPAIPPAIAKAIKM